MKEINILSILPVCFKILGGGEKLKRLNGVKILLCILCFIILIYSVLIYICINKVDREKINLYYINTGSTPMAKNDKFVAFCTVEGIMIMDNEGNEISRFLPSQFDLAYPTQITLGEEAYYLLYDKYSMGVDESSAMIVQVEYNSEKIKKIFYRNIDYISCQNGKLFLAKEDEKNLSSHYYSFSRLYANFYVEEKDFGEDLIELEADENGKCKLDGMTLYQYSDSFFSTSPQIDDYPGGMEVVVPYQANLNEILEGRRERTDCALVLDVVNLRHGQVCQILEYQEDTAIYGVCNLLAYDYSVKEVQMNKVLYSYYYKIVPETNKIDILFEGEGTYGILSTKEYVLYYSGEELCKRTIQDRGLDKWEIPQAKKLIFWIADNGVELEMPFEDYSEKIFWERNQKEFRRLFLFDDV